LKKNVNVINVIIVFFYVQSCQDLSYACILPVLGGGDTMWHSYWGIDFRKLFFSCMPFVSSHPIPSVLQKLHCAIIDFKENLRDFP